MKNEEPNEENTKVCGSGNECSEKKDKTNQLVSWSEILSKVLGCCARKISLIER